VTAFVIDASVVIKWVVDEPGSEYAVRLIDGPTLSAPDLLMSECANILWKKVRRSELSRDEASLAIELLVRADVELVPTRAIASRAVALSLDLDHPAYDCMYLALAIERGDAFVTADTRFVRLVAERGALDLRSKAIELGDVDRSLA
jgi:predicted nucleic acid-binding protein